MTEEAATTERKTRTPRKPKTKADQLIAIEILKQQLAKLESYVYTDNIEEVIAKTNILDNIKQIKEEAQSATDVAILQAIANAAGMKRIEVTLKPVVKREKKSS